MVIMEIKRQDFVCYPVDVRAIFMHKKVQDYVSVSVMEHLPISTIRSVLMSVLTVTFLILRPAYVQQSVQTMRLYP